jgi:mannose-6-phosphate isomerase-like protein (cupin superfamily)
MTQTPTLPAFTRMPSLEISKWYMGILATNLTEAKDTNAAYCMIEALAEPGNEPPPHVHSREDELFYLVEGKFDVYVGNEMFEVNQGGCVFLPRFKPHAFIIRSRRLRLLTLFTPGGIEEGFRSKSVPAQKLDLPAGAITYSTVDIQEVAQRMSERGVRILDPDEIARQLPLYPGGLTPT